MKPGSPEERGGREHRPWAARLAHSPTRHAELHGSLACVYIPSLSPAHCHAQRLQIYFMSCLTSPAPHLLRGPGGSQMPPCAPLTVTSHTLGALDSCVPVLPPRG